MAAPSFTGTTDYTVIREVPTVNTEGVDTVAITLEGRSTASAAEFASYTVNVTNGAGIGVGYSNMILKSKAMDDTGPFPRVDLFFHGLIGAGGSTVPATISDSIAEMSGSAPTTNDESVQFKFLGQRTVYRYMWNFANPPGVPRYPSLVPAGIGSDKVFDEVPANYTGKLKVRNRVRNMLFERFKLTPLGPWVVVEVWSTRLESTVAPKINS